MLYFNLLFLVMQMLVMYSSFEVVNLGGAGRFRLLTYEDYPNPRQSQDLLPIIQLTPFKIWPTEFCLRRNDRLQLNVSYLPTDIGMYVG